MAQAKEKSRGVLPDDYEVDLPERAHLEECPMDPDRLDWETVVPATGPHRGVVMVKVRCVDCGGEKLTPLET